MLWIILSSEFWLVFFSVLYHSCSFWLRF